jgi:hypothetical protein
MADAQTIHEALSAVMGDVQAVGKGQRVTSGPAQYAFRGVDAVVNAVGPALREHGVIVLPEVLEDTFREYQSKSGGQMQECRVRMRYTFVGPDGSTLACSAIGQSSDSSDKAASKAQSVAYRVALLQALCIPTDEPDPDSASHERAAPSPVIPGALARRVRDACTTKELRDLFRQRFGSGAGEVAADRADEVTDWLSDLEPVPPVEGNPK